MHNDELSRLKFYINIVPLLKFDIVYKIFVRSLLETPRPQLCHLYWAIHSKPHTCSWPCLVSWLSKWRTQTREIMSSTGKSQNLWILSDSVAIYSWSWVLERQESKLVNFQSAPVAQRDARQERTENSLFLILASRGLKTTCRVRQNPTEFTRFDSSQWRTLSHL